MMVGKHTEQNDGNNAATGERHRNSERGPESLQYPVFDEQMPNGHEQKDRKTEGADQGKFLPGRALYPEQRNTFHHPNVDETERRVRSF